jgi:hypothetical protein
MFAALMSDNTAASANAGRDIPSMPALQRCFTALS